MTVRSLVLGLAWLLASAAAASATSPPPPPARVVLAPTSPGSVVIPAGAPSVEVINTAQPFAMVMPAAAIDGSILTITLSEAAGPLGNMVQLMPAGPTQSVSDGVVTTAGPLPILVSNDMAFRYAAASNTWTMVTDTASPSFTADFVNGIYSAQYRGNAAVSTLAGLWTVANAGPATYTDSAGIVRDAAPNTLRKTYSAETDHPLLGALVERSSRNYVTRSTTTVGIGSMTAPGSLAVSTDLPAHYQGATLTGAVLKGVEDTHGWLYHSNPTNQIPAGAQVTCSLYIWIPGNILSDDLYAYLTSSTVGSWTTNYSKHADMSRRDQWQRIWTVGTQWTTSVVNPDFIVAATNSTRQGVDIAYFTMPQCEPGTAPTSFIPSDGTTPIRPADVLTPAPTNLVDMSSGGTLEVDASDPAPSLTAQADLTVSLVDPVDGSGNAAAIRFYGDPVAPSVDAVTTFGGSQQQRLTGGLLTSNSSPRVALSIDDGEVRLADSNGASTSAAAPNPMVPNLNAIAITPGGSTVLKSIRYTPAATRRASRLVSLANTSGPVTVTADPATLTGPVIPLDFVGLAFETSAVQQPLSLNNNAQLKAFLRVLGPSGNIRFGGNTCDYPHLTDPPSPYTHYQPTASRVADAGNFVAGLGAGWTVEWCINAPYFNTGTVSDITLATTLATTLPLSRISYSVGNEPNYFSSNYGSSLGTYPAWIAQWQTAHDALVSALTAAGIGGTPRWVGPDTGQRAAPYIQQFVADKGAQISIVGTHYYWNQYASTYAQRANNQQMMQDWSPDYVARGYAALAASIGVKARLTEGGSTKASGVGNTQAGALWDLYMMASYARSGWAGVDFEQGDNTAAFGPSNGYIPYLRNPDGTYYGQSPLYAMVLFNALVGGRVIPTSGTVGRQVTTLGVLGADGLTRLLILNRDVTRKAIVDVGSTGAVAAASVLTMTAPSPYATGATTINGAVIRSDGSFGPLPYAAPVAGGRARVVIPAAGAALVTLQ